MNGGIDMTQPNVLFVCLGNICRSTMAEAIFRNETIIRNLNYISDSAGTGDWHIGKEPHSGTREKLIENNISYADIYARQINAKDFDVYDYIIAMDSQNLKDIQALAPSNYIGELHTLLHFSPNTNLVDVPDPYYTGDFQETFNLITDAMPGLFNALQKNSK